LSSLLIASLPSSITATKVAANTQVHFESCNELEIWLRATLVDAFGCITEVALQFYLSCKISELPTSQVGLNRMWNIYKDILSSMFIRIHNMLMFYSPAYTLGAFKPSFTGPMIGSAVKLNTDKNVWFGVGKRLAF